eukprot:CAMPEP_0184425916 /NCGR_PEP_ID=MMETSP0738-20130409/142258_1 /TAXON_ID=385413 /ORGANISM="Thalassiosira miniscula, Strain CCMP1093" /LENGTH=32 /DNA_ID= /DNA_START= /DNA_END= /DNA_ORIENTATION=
MTKQLQKKKRWQEVAKIIEVVEAEIRIYGIGN